MYLVKAKHLDRFIKPKEFKKFFVDSNYCVSFSLSMATARVDPIYCYCDEFIMFKEPPLSIVSFLNEVLGNDLFYIIDKDGIVYEQPKTTE